MKISKVYLAMSAAATVLAVALPASASGPLTVTSYSMPNGDGQASGGSYNYWDLAYSGAGATSVDGAALSSGRGDLTDGVVAPTFWYLTENGAGTGPYVGWYKPVTNDPAITFNFASSVNVTDIAIQMDNSGVGGVFAPGAILVDGVSRAFSAPTFGTVGTVTLAGLNLVGSSHTIEFDQAPGTWTFVSEVSFSGAAGVPEPASWALMISGFGLAGTALRRRRTVVSA